MWRVTLRGLRARKFRLFLTSISVMLGVGFVAGTLVFTDTLGHVFDQLFAQVTSGEDAVVRARLPFKVNVPGGGSQADRAPVPASLLGVVQSTPGVSVAQGSVQGVALVVGKDGKAVQGQAPTLGVSWGSVPQLNRSFNSVQGVRPNRPDQVALDRTTADKAKAKVGDQVRIVFQTVPPQTFAVSAVFRFGDAGNLAGATLAAFEPTTAQLVLGRVGQWDQIDAVAASGLSQQQLRDRLTASLDRAGVGGRYEAITATALAQETSSDIKKNLSFFSNFLLVFALVALFVGAFSIYNTFSITVAQRAREFGLLRAVGASGAQVTRSVAGESLAVGLVSSVVGLGLGVGAAVGLKAILTAFGVDLPAGGLQILPRTVVVALVVGTVVTVISALAPARRAARIPPIAALRDQTGAPGSGQRRFITGGVVTGVGLVLGAVGLFGNIKSSQLPGGGAGLVGGGAFLVFVGVAMLSPLIAGPAARMLGWPSVRLRGITGELARENAMRNTRRTASTAAALMIGLALVTLVSIFGASAKASFTSAVDRTNRADFQLAGKIAGFSPEAAAAARSALPGGTVVEFRPGSWQYRGTGNQLVGVPSNVQDVVDIGLRPGADLAGFAGGGVLVYKDAAKDNHWSVGDVIPMRFSATGTKQVPVRGIYDDNQGLGVSIELVPVVPARLRVQLHHPDRHGGRRTEAVQHQRRRDSSGPDPGTRPVPEHQYPGPDPGQGRPGPTVRHDPESHVRLVAASHPDRPRRDRQHAGLVHLRAHARARAAEGGRHDSPPDAAHGAKRGDDHRRIRDPHGRRHRTPLRTGDRRLPLEGQHLLRRARSPAHPLRRARGLGRPTRRDLARAPCGTFRRAPRHRGPVRARPRPEGDAAAVNGIWSQWRPLRFRCRRQREPPIRASEIIRSDAIAVASSVTRDDPHTSGLEGLSSPTKSSQLVGAPRKYITTAPLGSPQSV